MDLGPDARDWVLVTPAPLPVAEALAWANEPSSGGNVLFTGTVRDHAEGRPGVVLLEYEAYEHGATRALGRLAEEARHRWPALGRLALLHRVGPLHVGEVAVVVLAAAPHRAEAFDAARWCIDTLKRTVPIWKHETWAGGSDWSACAHEAEAVAPPLPTGAEQDS